MIVHERPFQITAYLTGYALILFNAFVHTTAFSLLYPNKISIMIRLAGYGFLALRLVIIMRERIPMRTLLAGSVLLILSCISYYYNSYGVLLDYAICCAFAVGIEFRDIVRLYVYESVSLTAITIAAALLGIIDHYIYYRSGSGAIRMSMGFVYPTDFAAHVFFVTAGTAYLTYDKFSLMELTVFGAVAYGCFLLTNARGPCIIIFVLAALFFLFRQLYKKEIKIIPIWLLKYSPVVCATASLLVIGLFHAESAFWKSLNAISTNRLSLAKSLMEQNQITLFGQFIQQRGEGLGGRAPGEAYTFIDISFQRMLLMYGLVILFLVLVCSVILNCKAIRAGNMALPLLMLVISVYSMTAQHYLDFSYNFVLLAVFAEISVQRADALKRRCRLVPKRTWKSLHEQIRRKN